MTGLRGVPPWFVVLLVVSSLLSLNLAFLTTPLPDGRLVRIRALKPHPNDTDFDLHTNIGINRSDRRPRPKPKPTGNSTAHPQVPPGSSDATMCGLDAPSPENWEKNKKAIGEWFSEQFENYLNNAKYQSIALYLRDIWAPDAVPSSLFCNAVGSCSIGSCRNLIADDGTNHHDRQMALYVFEQLANADHLFKAVDKQLTDAINSIMHRSDRIVEEFSSAPRIEKAFKDALRREELGMAIGIALGLVVAAGFGFLPAVAAATSATIGSASANLVVSSYVGVVTTLNTIRPGPDFVDDLKDAFRNDLGTILDGLKTSIEMDLHDLMIGGADFQKRTVVHLMTDSDFLQPNPDFMPSLGEHVGRVVVGSAVNKTWDFDRSYIVLVENPGGCERERTTYVRGPHEYLICLPEHPELGFWMYSIDRGHEDDSHEAMVRGPTGFWRLNDNPDYFNITLEDIARSSYWAYQTDLVLMKGERIQFDPLSIDPTGRAETEKERERKRMLGVFTVPICFNPGGEAISGVLHEKGQNYPCMCGNFSWNGRDYSHAKDETLRFLLRTGFGYSDDWQGYCSDGNDCESDSDVEIRHILEGARKPNDPGVPGDLKHLFKKCKRKDSRKHPGWPDRDMNETTKRNRLDWARYDEKRRGGFRVAAGFEG